MRRPIDEPVNITGDRATHAAYGVGPATDYGCDIGTPIYAPFSGALSTYVTDEGGLGVVLVGDDATFYGQHLWVRMSPGRYTEGDRIALSGNSGTQTTGPHLHCYVIIHATGERLSMEEYLTRTAGGNARPFPPSEEDDMTPEQAKQLAEVHQVLVTGTPDNPSVATVVALTYQTLGVVRQVLMAEGDPFKGITVVVAENHKMLEKLLEKLPA